MSKRSPIQVIEHSYDLVHGSFFCPCCGAALMRPDSDLLKCPHVLFGWIDQGSGIVEELLHPKLAPIVTECERLDIDTSPYDAQFLARLPERTVVFLLWERYGPSAMVIAFALEWPEPTP
ncbi:MAG: hypothetical protein FJ298_07045 [Planctomycetes bacterium]|nr:hypothetical protein [Planctomycetota bacterium]